MKSKELENCTFKPKTNRKKSEPPLTARDLPRIYQQAPPEQKSFQGSFGPDRVIDKKAQDELITAKGMLVPKSMVNLSDLFGTQERPKSSRPAKQTAVPHGKRFNPEQFLSS